MSKNINNKLSTGRRCLSLFNTSRCSPPQLCLKLKIQIFFNKYRHKRSVPSFARRSSLIRAVFVWPWKMVSVSVCYLFYQPRDEKNQTLTLRFPAKENPKMEKELFDWPILLRYDVKAISRKFFGHEVFSTERSLNQPKARCVCIRSINQSDRFLSVRLLFLCCSRVFISRSYKNRSMRDKPQREEPSWNLNSS